MIRKVGIMVKDSHNLTKPLHGKGTRASNHKEPTIAPSGSISANAKKFRTIGRGIYQRGTCVMRCRRRDKACTNFLAGVTQNDMRR